MSKISRYDLFGLGLIVVIAIISIARFENFPQFIDAYYHLAVANGFIESGGWVGWDWWSFAPFGRPHLYPPFYHFILVFLQTIGLEALNSVKLTGVVIVPLFFFFVWYTFRKILSDKFAFFAVLTLSSFFPFYSAVSENIPASLAMIFGFLAWAFLKNGKYISSSLFLTLAFYTHVGLAWVFLASFLSLAVLNKEYRQLSIKVILIAVLLIIPFLLHQLKYIDFLVFNLLGEANFTKISIFMVLLGVVSFVMHFGKRQFPLPLFLGYVLAATLVFIKYPYRLFSGQGIIGLSLFVWLILERLSIRAKPKKAKYLLPLAFFYLFFFHSTLELGQSKVNLRLFDSTYYRYLTAEIESSPRFNSVFSSDLYSPIIEVIKGNSSKCQIIASNSRIASQIFSALANRPSANSMLQEVKPKKKFSSYSKAKLIICLKTADLIKHFKLLKPKLKVIYENDLAYVILNPAATPCVKAIKSTVTFNVVILLFILIAAVLLKDSAKSSKD